MRGAFDAELAHVALHHTWRSTKRALREQLASDLGDRCAQRVADRVRGRADPRRNTSPCCASRAVKLTDLVDDHPDAEHLLFAALVVLDDQLGAVRAVTEAFEDRELRARLHPPKQVRTGGGHRAEQHVGPTKAPVAEQEHPRPKGPDQVERKRVPARLVASHRDIYKRVRTALAEADEADLSERRALTPSRCRTTELAVVQRRGGRPSQHPERGMIGETLVGLRPDPPCSRYRRRMP